MQVLTQKLLGQSSGPQVVHMQLFPQMYMPFHLYGEYKKNKILQTLHFEYKGGPAGLLLSSY
jgi:hypothetical protein